MTQHLQIYHQGLGPQIHLLHGWAMNSSVFEPLAQRLQDRFRVNRVDLPGHGRTPLTDSDFDGQVDALAKGVKGGTLVGWSMGGLYAIALAGRYPERYDRLLLVTSNPCFVQRDDWHSAMPTAVFDEFARDLFDDWRVTIKRFIGLQVHGADRARELIRRITALVLEGGTPQPEALQFGLRLLLERDVRGLLASTTIPVRAILGGRDKLVPASLAEQLPQLNSAIEVKCLERAAHAPFLSHQDVFVNLLDEFVESTQA